MENLEDHRVGLLESICMREEGMMGILIEEFKKNWREEN